MELTEEDILKICFLTRTGLSKLRIKRLAKYFDDFSLLIDKINRINYPDLDKDWTLFDHEYKNNKIIYATNVKIITEKDIFKGTYVHKCKNDRNYIIQIIGKSGYCKRCDTQFFPKLWWDHPLKEHLNYKDIKYGENIKIIPISLNDHYLNKLLNFGVNKNILEKSASQLHSPYEIELMLKTQYYDKKNPPPASKIHSKLMILNNIWETRPVKNLGSFPDVKYFFHKCKKNDSRILFQEKYFYPWCPGCHTKFIPQWDNETIEIYKQYITVKTFIPQENRVNNNSNNIIDGIKLNSPEYFYLSILGINERCSVKELLDTFRKLSKTYHPDYGGSSEMFQKIVKAKDWLLKYYNNSLYYYK